MINPVSQTSLALKWGKGCINAPINFECCMLWKYVNYENKLFNQNFKPYDITNFYSSGPGTVVCTVETFVCINATFSAFRCRWRLRNGICRWTLHTHSPQDVPLFKHIQHFLGCQSSPFYQILSSVGAAFFMFHFLKDEHTHSHIT